MSLENIFKCKSLWKLQGGKAYYERTTVKHGKHHLKCDAARNSNKACSRCTRRNISCVTSHDFRRVGRPRVYQLLAEIDHLRREKHSTSLPPAQVSFEESDTTVQPATSPQEDQDWTVAASVAAEPYTYRSPVLSTSCSNRAPPQGTSFPRTIQEQTVSGEDVDACFQIFLQNQLAYVPILDASLRPDDCYAYSPLLFWTILAIGSMRFEQDPTLIISLGSKVIDLAKEAVFSCKDVIATIQAFTLLCAWPMPFDTLERDPSPSLAGAALQLAINSGLHVWGIGQDFSRRRVNPGGSNAIDFRAKLWVNCLIVCQRINIANGVSPPTPPDTYHQEKYGERLSATLTPSIKFLRRLCLVHSEGIVSLEKTLSFRSSEAAKLALEPQIQIVLANLKELQTTCPSSYDQFALDGAIFQISCFHLLLPQSAPSHDKLLELFDLAVNYILLGVKLDETQNISQYAPPMYSRIMFLACCVLLRIARSNLEVVDLKRGREAYFKTINLHKRLSVRHDDAASRGTVILSQLWSGKMVGVQTKRHGGQVHLKCQSRLGMGLLYDCWWLWRQEFQGLPDPYPEEDNPLNLSTAEDDMAFLTTPTSTDFGNMDLWWPAYEIFTGTGVPDVGVGVGNGFPAAFSTQHSLPSPFPP